MYRRNSGEDRLGIYLGKHRKIRLLALTLGRIGRSGGTEGRGDAAARLVTMPETIPDDIDALKVALVAEREARQQAEARASGAEASRPLQAADRQAPARAIRQSSERGRKLLDQLELQLEGYTGTQAIPLLARMERAGGSHAS